MGFLLKNLDISTYHFSSEKIAENITFALIADLHECYFGPGNRNLLEAVDEMNPDGVIIAGDLIVGDNRPDRDGRAVFDFLSKLSEKYRVFYGVGNHERRVIISRSLRSKKRQLREGLKKAGVRLMSNTVRRLPSSNINIYALDLGRRYYGHFKRRPPEPGLLTSLLGRPDPGSYNVLIAHNPEHFAEYALWGADLVLSGHVHGGIVRLPLLGGVLSPSLTLFPEYDAGRFRAGSSEMLVSRGTGSHSIPLRVNNNPELIRLELTTCKR